MTHEDDVVVVRRADPAAHVVAAEELARVIATNLHGAFATVIDTAMVLRPR